jgi:hypothetical protein
VGSPTKSSANRPKVRRSAGDTVALEYDARGYPVGETALNADFSRGKQYRRVLAMSERAQGAHHRRGVASFT